MYAVAATDVGIVASRTTSERVFAVHVPATASVRDHAPSLIRPCQLWWHVRTLAKSAARRGRTTHSERKTALLCSSILSCMARRSSPSDANDASTPLLYTHVRCARTRRTSQLCRAAATAIHAAAWIVLTDTSAQHPVSESCCRHVYPNHQKSRFSEFFRNSFFFFLDSVVLVSRGTFSESCHDLSLAYQLSARVGDQPLVRKKQKTKTSKSHKQ